ncbi:MAG: N-acetylmuramoyl-L-alanine amidase [Hyphomonadaceae bacterium]
MTFARIDAPTPNFNDRLHPVDMLVLHYTGMEDGPSALARLRDPASEVSAHYVVEEDGSVYVLAPEEKRAWHAGRSRWQGDDDLNSRSIGVEIVNGGHDYGLPPFPDAQIDAVIALSREILARWGIPQSRVVGHSDIAPDRKQDPGERFPWARLAMAGVGLWPRAPRSEDFEGPPCDIADLQGDLKTIGYAVEPSGALDETTHAVLRAFQRRWRPSAITGEVDAETCRLARDLAEQRQSGSRAR